MPLPVRSVNASLLNVRVWPAVTVRPAVNVFRPVKDWRPDNNATLLLRLVSTTLPPLILAPLILVIADPSPVIVVAVIVVALTVPFTCTIPPDPGCNVMSPVVRLKLPSLKVVLPAPTITPPKKYP